MNPLGCSTGAGACRGPTARPVPGLEEHSAPVGPAVDHQAGRGPHRPPHTGSPTLPCLVRLDWLGDVCARLGSIIL